VQLTAINDSSTLLEASGNTQSPKLWNSPPEQIASTKNDHLRIPAIAFPNMDTAFLAEKNAQYIGSSWFCGSAIGHRHWRIGVVDSSTISGLVREKLHNLPGFRGSEQPPLGKAQCGCACHDEMVEHLHINQRQRLFQVGCQNFIGPAGFRYTTWMVVRKDDRRRILP